MIRFAPFAVLFLSAAPLVHARDTLLWQAGYSGPGGGPNSASAVVSTPAGEVVVAGVSAGSGGSSSAPRSDVLFQKYDAQGALVWQQVLDLGGNEAATGIVRDAASGALFACGVRSAQLPQTPTAAGWLVWRLDPATGAVLWQREYRGPNLTGGSPRGIAIDATGAVVVTGFVYGPATDDSDGALVRYGADGTQLAERVWTSTAQTFGDVVGGAAALPDGSVAVSGSDGNGVAWLRRVSTAGADLAFVQGAVGFGSVNADDSGNVFTIEGGVLRKRDANLQPVWSLAGAQLFADGAAPTRLAHAPGGALRVASTSARVASVGAAGNVQWDASVPSTHALEVGFVRQITVAANGDALLATEGATSGGREFVAVARFDAAGSFLWNQSVLGGPAQPVQNLWGVVAARQDASVICGTFGTSSTSSDQRLFVAALREQSHKLCFGDGSSGTCPCGNNSNPALGAGCTGGAAGGVRLEDFGVASLATDTLTFEGLGVSMLGPAVLLQSASVGAATPFQNGLLCLGGPLQRMYVGTPNSIAHIVPPPGAPSVSVRSAQAGFPIAAGTTRYYQLYFRTAPTACGGANANLSNGIEVRWGL